MTTQYTVSSISTFCQYANQYFKNPDDVSVIFDVGSLHCLESSYLLDEVLVENKSSLQPTLNSTSKGDLGYSKVLLLL